MIFLKIFRSLHSVSHSAVFNPCADFHFHGIIPIAIAFTLNRNFFCHSFKFKGPFRSSSTNISGSLKMSLLIMIFSLFFPPLSKGIVWDTAITYVTHSYFPCHLPAGVISYARYQHDSWGADTLKITFLLNNF